MTTHQALFGAQHSVKGMVLKVSPNGRYLTDQTGKPFFYLGDTAWTLLKRLNRKEIDLYYHNRLAKGFNVIQMYLLRGLNVKDRYGNTPLIDGDPAKPNEKFYQTVDYAINRANELGLVIGGVVTWGAHVFANSYNEQIFTETNAYLHGKFLGNRYQDNCVVWYLGGDKDPNERMDIWISMAKGLKDGSKGKHLVSFHGPGMAGIPSSSTWFHHEDWLDFNVMQTGHGWTVDNYNFVAHDYGLTPVKPVLDMEAAYENHPDMRKITNKRIDAHQIRESMYWQVLAGAAGHGYGCNDIWPFYDTDTTQKWQDYAFPQGLHQNTYWRTAMDFHGATCVGLARKLFELRPWYKLVPDQSIVAEGQGEGEFHIQSAREADGSFILVYSTMGSPFGVDMSKLSSRNNKALWFNPRDGRFTKIDGEYANTGLARFVPPTHYDGDDWVLVLEDETKNYPTEL